MFWATMISLAVTVLLSIAEAEGNEVIRNSMKQDANRLNTLKHNVLLGNENLSRITNAIDTVWANLNDNYKAQIPTDKYNQIKNHLSSAKNAALKDIANNETTFNKASTSNYSTTGIGALLNYNSNQHDSNKFDEADKQVVGADKVTLGDYLNKEYPVEPVKPAGTGNSSIKS